jgi:hyperosmotically inducible protein
MKKIISLTFVAIFAMALIGCETTTNTNTNVRTNMNANSNVAVVVNNNSNMVMNANMSNSRMNSNMTREEYNKSRADIEKDKGSSTIGQGANDSWLWFKTRTALLATNELRESTINVDVVNDVVTLRGTVASKAESDKAASVAKGIDGVKSVTNQLKVAPNDSMTNMSTNTGNKSANSNMKK